MTKFPFVQNQILQRYDKTIYNNNTIIRILQCSWWEQRISYISTMINNNNYNSSNYYCFTSIATTKTIVTTIQSNEFRTYTMMLPKVPISNDRLYTLQRQTSTTTIQDQIYGKKGQIRFLSSDSGYNNRKNNKDVDDLLTNVALIKYLQRLKKQRNTDLIQVRIVPLKLKDSYITPTTSTSTSTCTDNGGDVATTEETILNSNTNNSTKSKDNDNDDSDSDDDDDDDDDDDESDDDNNDTNTNNNNENDTSKDDNTNNNDNIKNTTKVISLADAVKEATSLKLDIIAVSLTAPIPVVQYGNASSIKYHLQKKLNAVRKIIKQKQNVANKLKEITIKNRCAEYDLQRKINNLLSYITKGHHVQITIRSKKWDTADIDNTVQNVLSRIQNDAELSVPPKKNDVGNIVTIQVSPLSSSSSSTSKKTTNATKSLTDDNVTESTITN